MTQFTKPVISPVTTRQEIHTLVSANGSGLTYTLCDRTDLSSKEANYFVSFNLPYQSDAFLTGDTLSLSNPELQQLNVDNIVIVDIDSQYYNEIIDGRSVNFTVPQSELSGTSISAKTIISSTYKVLEKSSRDPFLGTNVAFLFSDDINKPYTGVTSGGEVDRSGRDSWINSENDSVVAGRIATSYEELSTIDVNSDTRPLSGINYAVSVPSGYPTNTDLGYNYDIPVGFVALDKGYLVLTHPDIVNNIPYSQGFHRFSNLANTGSGTTDIYFSDISDSNARFIDIDVNFTSSFICMIMPGEFYKTTNPSYDSVRANQEEIAGTNGMDPVYISEIALHNTKGEIIAYAKLDRPLQKTFSDFVSFTVDIKA